MKTIYQLEFYSSVGVLLRTSHRVFSSSEKAVSYGDKVLSQDRLSKYYKITFLILD